MHLKEIDANLIVVLDSLLLDASVTRAAERLGRSPSAVSHALSNLREIFQDELFVRAGQRLVPTSKAEELAPTVHVICAGIEGLLRPTVPLDLEHQNRKFIFACPQVCELAVLGDTRHLIQKEAAGIELECWPYAGEKSLEDLRQNKVQFVISQDTPRGDAADFVWRPFHSERYATIAPATHPATGKKPGKAAFSSYEHVLVAWEADGASRVIEHFENHGIKADKLQVVPSALTALTIALESGCLATLPASACSAISGRLGAKEVSHPFPALTIQTYICWHRSQDRDECHEWVRGLLLEAASKI